MKCCSLDLFIKSVYSLPTKTTKQGLTTGNGTAIVHSIEMKLSFYYYREVQFMVMQHIPTEKECMLQ